MIYMFAKLDRNRCKLLTFFLLLLCGLLPNAALASNSYQDMAGQYLSVDEFLQLGFGNGAQVSPAVFWLTPEVKTRLKATTGRDFPLLRVRYWSHENNTAWILEEIGKERPITIGVIVDSNTNAVVRVEILAFRESRGWEVRHAFFTRQFKGVSLNQKDLLNQHIDGITGATLSVWAVKRVAQFALILAAAVQTATDLSTAE